MNRADILCSMNCAMVEVFSQNTITDLKSHTLFKLALPPLQSLLAINVDKETEKDRRVIVQAAEVYRRGSQPGSKHVNSLLQQAREIDQAFLHEAALFPVNIQIQYQDIERYRQQRIELLLHTSYRIFEQWHGVNSLRRVLQELYSEQAFEQLLHDILRLYAMETRMLSRSVRLPQPLALAREAITQTITRVMAEQADTLSKSLAKRVYHRGV